MKQFFLARWFLILLALVLVVGIGGWRQLAPIASSPWFRDGVVACVLFLMALPLAAETVGKVLRRPLAPALGFAVNLGLTPLIAWGIAQALRDDTAAGLLVAAATPTTLASAAVWTRRAGGNDAVAVFITVLTNGLCFLLTPLWLRFLLGARAGEVQLDVVDLIGKLGLLVFLPMAAAQAARLLPSVGEWASRRSKALSVAAQCGVLVMVLIGAIKTGQLLHQQPEESVFSAWDWFNMVAAVLALHLSALACGYFLAGGLRLPREDRIAVGFGGSQKTLMIGLQVAIECGILILPMVIYHVGQLLVDTLIADRWRRRGDV